MKNGYVKLTTDTLVVENEGNFMSASVNDRIQADVPIKNPLASDLLAYDISDSERQTYLSES